MDYATLLSQIKTAVESVTDIGQVHDMIRGWKNDNEFRTLFETTISSKKQIRGWTITRDGIPENSRYATGGQHQITHQFVIRGYLGLEDANETEKTIQALVESVLQKLDNAVTLGGNVRVAGPATAPVIAHREFGNVLCHYAEIQYPVTEHVARTYS